MAPVQDFKINNNKSLYYLAVLCVHIVLEDLWPVVFVKGLHIITRSCII